MADAETEGKLVVPGRLTGYDVAFERQAVTPAEGLKDVTDKTVRCIVACSHQIVP